MGKNRIAVFLLLLGAVCLTGCSKESDGTPAANAAANGGQPGAAMTAAQRQNIAQMGKVHQAGGRIRGNVMHRTQTPP